MSTENKSETYLCNILTVELVCQGKFPQEVFPSCPGLLLSPDSCLPLRQLLTRDLAAHRLEMVAGQGAGPGEKAGEGPGQGQGDLAAYLLETVARQDRQGIINHLWASFCVTPGQIAL